MTLLRDIGQPAIPTAAERDLAVGPGGDALDPKGIVQYLDVDAQLVHMFQTKIYIVELARGLRRFEVSPGALREIVELALSESQETKAGDFVVDDPVLPGRIGGSGIKLRAEFLLGRIEIVPGALGLDHMGIRVDDGN